MDRINWIDWAKAIAITMVVFGHIPEDSSNFLLRYVCIFHMPFFFFISGYLSKRRVDLLTNLHKYWKSLIIPYFLYNILFYPYWLIRYKLENWGDFSASEIMVKPLMGTLFGQIETPISCTVSGVTWFLIALFFMRIIVDLCNNFKKNISLMIIASLIITIIYISSEYHDTMNNLIMKGFSRCFPFYVMGHLLQRKQLYTGTNWYFNASIAIILYTISIAIFILTKHSGLFWVEIVRGYCISITAIFALLGSCKLLNNYTSKTLINISTGTIMIMGLHWMFIGIINYILEHLFGIKEIRYEWYCALFTSISIVTMIYPMILISKKYFPILLGK